MTRTKPVSHVSPDPAALGESLAGIAERLMTQMDDTGTFLAQCFAKSGHTVIEICLDRRRVEDAYMLADEDD